MLKEMECLIIAVALGRMAARILIEIFNHIKE